MILLSNTLDSAVLKPGFRYFSPEDRDCLVKALLASQCKRAHERTFKAMAIALQVLRLDRYPALSVHDFKPDALRDGGTGRVLLIELKSVKCLGNSSRSGVHLAGMIGKGEDTAIGQSKARITRRIIGEHITC